MVPIKKRKLHWLTVLVHAWVLLSLASLAWDYTHDQFLVDRVREITTRTGRMALTLLLLSLACTPINIVLGYKRVLRVRRALGLYAFVYASLHAWAFVGLDYGFDLELLRPAILDQRFVLAGLGAFLILLALALTSTKVAQRRLRKNWRRLHRLVYLAGGLVILHFLWLVKDTRGRLRYGALLALMLGIRLRFIKKPVKALRRRLQMQRVRFISARRRS